MKFVQGVLFLVLVPGLLLAQTNASLTGRYFFRYMQLKTASGGAINHMESMAGVLTFDGAGKYTFASQHTSDTATPDQPSGSGTYAVSSNGNVSMTSPIGSGLTLNARLGTGLLLGSSTEAAVISGGTTVDLLIALPATAVAVSNSTFSGTYQFANLDFPNADPTRVRSAMYTATADGKGGLGFFAVNGHAANLAGGAVQSQPFAGSYAVAGDGTGSINLSPVTGAAPVLLSGPRTFYISPDGNYILGATTTAGGHDWLVGVRTAATSSNSTFSGLFFSAGLALGSSGLTAFTGSSNSGGAGSLLFYRRLHYAVSPGGTLDFTGAATYALGTDGSGTSLLLHMGANANLAFFVAEGDLDPADYELNIAVRAPSFNGTGVFLSPVGVVNAAGLAPAGNPVSPGEYVSLFGAGLAAASLGASSLPLPKALATTSVRVNGIAAPLNYVSANQINALVPFGVTGNKATFVVTNGASNSASVDVPLAATSPGIFSQTSSGSGAAVVLKADYSLVTAANPAHRGDVLQIYLTGLGAVSPAISDGAAAPSTNLSLVTAPITVLVGGQSSAVQFKGLAPGFAGLYQVNAAIPSNAPLGDQIPLSISTNEAFHDQVSIPIH